MKNWKWAIFVVFFIYKVPKCAGVKICLNWWQINLSNPTLSHPALPHPTHGTVLVATAQDFMGSTTKSTFGRQLQVIQAKHQWRHQRRTIHDYIGSLVLGDTFFIFWITLHQLKFFQISNRKTKNWHGEIYHYIP